jgi:penicillin-binding protein A
MRHLCTEATSRRGVVSALALGLTLACPLEILAEPTWDGWARADNESGSQVLLETVTTRAGRCVADLEGGGLAELTLDPALQTSVEETFANFEVPYGGAVAISIPDGRVLALVGKSALDPELGPTELALRPWAPAASVFKLVAASALIEEAQLSGGTRVCYHGGVSSIMGDNLVDMPQIDSSCASLGYAIGKSQNAVVAKLAARYLTRDGLGHLASAFGFGQPIPFEVAVEPSDVEIPATPLEFARAAAGFWHSSLSAMHGALIAAAIANRGEMPAPRLIAKAIDGQGQVIELPSRAAHRVVDAKVAEEVGRMMALTTTMGTAKHGFHDRRGHAYLPVSVAGKTGTLNYRGGAQDPPLPGAALLPPRGGLGYNWFVGYAPVDKPRIAFAVVVGNPQLWRIKATFVARRLLADYLARESGAGHTDRAVAAK